MQKNSRKFDLGSAGFWTLATKWWFFPALYAGLALSLTLFFFMDFSYVNFFSGFIIFLLVMPLGITYYFSSANQPYLGYFLILFHAFAAASILRICQHKNKEEASLRWHIAGLIILIAVSFFGFVYAIQDYIGSMIV